MKNRNQNAGAQEVPEVFTFDHKHKPVRVEMIDGEPWFVAKDVSRLDDDEKTTSVLPTQFGDKEMWFVNESGLYNLIFQSRKPEAKAFRKWVTSILLPVIRKTGKYAPEEVENDCPYTVDLFPPDPPAFCQATPEWLLNLMNDVCHIEDTGLRTGMAAKLMAVRRIL
jgi:hypothetical protein